MSSSRKVLYKNASFRGRKARWGAQRTKAADSKALIRRIARLEAVKAIQTQAEEKFVDTQQAVPTGVTTTGTVFLLTHPSNGTDVNTRIGDKITVKRIELQYSVQGYDTTNLLRVIVFKWNNDESIYTPVVGSIIQSAYVTTASAPLAPLNWDNIHAGDSDVLYDKVHALSWNNTTSAPGSEVHVERVLLQGKDLGTKATVQLNSGSAIGDGMYGLIVISDSAIAGHPKFNYTARLVYTDV